MRVMVAVVGLFVFVPSGHSKAMAQAQSNAVKEADDAFGFRSGDEAVGIYDESSVRGFSLEAAGNFRVNGTYFVKNSGVSSFFLESTTVRIGYNTLNSILPGPSGVVDYRLRDPAAGEPSSLTVGLDIYSQPYVDFNLKGRTDRSSYSAGVGRVFELRDQQGGTGGESLLLAGSGRLNVGTGKARVFAGEYQYERPGLFRVAPSADALPPHIERGRFLGQPWAVEEGQRRIAGVLLDTDDANRSGIGATAVFSQEDPTRGFAQFFTNLQSDGTARAIVIATPAQRSTAWSGELRAHYQRPIGRLAQRLDLTVRGRLSRSRFNRSRTVELGRTAFGERPAEVSAPDLDVDNGSRTSDDVDQYGVGLTYRASLANVFRLNLGALKTDYRKVFTTGGGVAQEIRARPLLYNIGAAWRVLNGLEVYGSYSRGLEEAGVAPASASNRNEVLNAIIVTQRELGLRYALSDRLNLVVAGFDTDKPYAGIDSTSGAFRFLGQVRHRGIETSLSGVPTPGLSIVVGGVFVDPVLTGTEVDAGRIGDRPVGVPQLRGIASADYEVAGVRGLSLDIATVFVGPRPARSTVSNSSGKQLHVETVATVSLGARYRMKVAGLDLVARAQVLNVFDQYTWEVNSSETLTYSAPRRFRLVLTTLF